MKMKSVYAQINGIAYHVNITGSGPLCLCLHGFPETRHSWRNQVALLSEKYTVAVPDMRGYGETESPEDRDAYKISVLIEDIRGLVNTFGQGRAVIVAHDWGGVVALHYSETYPHTVEKLVISNAPHLYDYATLFLKTKNIFQILKSWYVFANQIPQLNERLLSAHDFLLLEILVKLYAVKKDVFTPDVMAEWKKTLRTSGLKGGVDYYRANLRAFRYILEDGSKGKKITCPVSVIWGETDRALEKDLAYAIANHVSGPFDIHFIKDSGHWVQQEQPVVYNSHLSRFLGISQ
ncbi:MAG: alpha/beta hydrolase [Proteobacteria bacterium]|nr:alpha/beta hydrolase [Pseudomonadota bacterium]